MAAKPIKKYRVGYSFQGNGSIIVTGTSMKVAENEARKILKDLVPILRPESAKVYGSLIDIIPDDSPEEHSRTIFRSWEDPEERKLPTSESVFGDTPTHIEGLKHQLEEEAKKL